MDKWLVLQSFYNGLTMTSRANIDAAAGGAFLDLTVAKSKALVEKMVSNQGWSDERLQPRTKGMHTVKETDMIAAKLDLLIKKMEEGSKQQIHAPFTPWVRTSPAKSVVMMDTRGTTAPKPMKTAPTSTTTTTTGTVHNKEARGGTSHVHLFREVITTILLIIRISIQTNLP